MKLLTLINELSLLYEAGADQNTEVVVVRQTGPDSWIVDPITKVDAPTQIEGSKKSFIVLE